MVMAKKLPYMQFYTGEFLKDPLLSLCVPATRGVWMDLLCAMHELDRVGELRGTPDQLARTARCQPVELVQALTDLRTTGAADIEERNGVWIVCNRRMRDEYAKRKSNAERQMRHRQAHSNSGGNGDITPLSEVDIEIAFEEFWRVYPKGRKKSKAVAREAYGKALCRATSAVINAAAEEYARSEAGRGKYVKMPSTWLNQECWNDDRQAWRDLDGSSANLGQGKIYREISSDEFSKLYRAGKFLGRPVKDKVNELRWFAQLQDKSYVETFVKKKDDQCQ